MANDYDQTINSVIGKLNVSTRLVGVKRFQEDNQDIFFDLVTCKESMCKCLRSLRMQFYQ